MSSHRPRSAPAGRARVIALAGRRIDAADAKTKRFQMDRVAVVARRLRATFRTPIAGTLVSAAANGADLVALRVAHELGMRCRIILPFSASRFRRVSVTDRPCAELWGWLFDDAIARARSTGDLVVLGKRRGGDAVAFARANERIIAEALRLAGDDAARVSAVIVWEGSSRGEGDATASFAEMAHRAGMRLKSVHTGAR